MTSVKLARRAAVAVTFLAVAVAFAALLWTYSASASGSLLVDKVRHVNQFLTITGHATVPSRFLDSRRFKLRVSVVNKSGSGQLFSTRVSHRSGKEGFDWKIRFPLREPGTTLVRVKFVATGGEIAKSLNVVSTAPRGCWPLSEAEKAVRKTGEDLNPGDTSTRFHFGTGGSPPRVVACRARAIAAWKIGDRKTAKVLADAGLYELACLGEEQYDDVPEEAQTTFDLNDISRGDFLG